MTLEETRCFKMLDEYARSRHRCFLAEMNFDANEVRYALCFRPMGGSKDSTYRYACRYVYIGAHEVGATEQILPKLVIDILDAQLPTLPQS